MWDILGSPVFILSMLAFGVALVSYYSNRDCDEHEERLNTKCRGLESLIKTVEQSVDARKKD